MTMQRTRTIAGAAAHFREIDPHTAITERAIRQAVLSGIVPSCRVGTKHLVTIENLERYFFGEAKSAMREPQSQYGAIRGVAE
ncbi:MAG: hypothetical protein LBI19_02830 [Oscillospiraceae bacterium]|jgi:hypothetical protein|nr:hypothetical protein [Oscillospiraceae bacterium]